MKKTLTLLSLLLLFCTTRSAAQLKYVVEDFEGLATGQESFKHEGIFTYGSAETVIEQKVTTGYGYSGDRAMRINWTQKKPFGGWGKGICQYVELNTNEDYLNLYVYSPKSNAHNSRLKIILEDDDNDNGAFDEKFDDQWYDTLNIKYVDEWQLVSIPLSSFKDGNAAGDSKFNINHKEGRLLTFLVSFLDSSNISSRAYWYFDFISFSQGKLPTWVGKFVPPAAEKGMFCHLGAWSEEGNDKDNLLEIPYRFESNFKGESDKKLAVVHFFKPLSIGGAKEKQLLPNAERVNWLVDKGYIPMITLEDHYVKVNRRVKQPNLYSIVEGHFDPLFREWAKKMKEINGTVMLRILHEFNGDWYPWCISKNDNNPQLYIKAYQHIWSIFEQEKVTNVKFIWCPNSTSYPQASWNYLMDAYPGDKFVDFVAIDVYNGAGQESVPVWASFRKEAIQTYYLLTKNLPNKPLLICETSSRERKGVEKGALQDKAGWIAQMSEALKSDFSKVTLLSWFNQEKFKVNSSSQSRTAYLKYILNDNYFKSGKDSFFKP